MKPQEELENLIDYLKKNTEYKTKEAISVMCGYEKATLTQYKGDPKKTAGAIKQIKIAFQHELNNSMSGNVSFAREPETPYGANIQVHKSLKALKDAVAQLEADLSGPEPFGNGFLSKRFARIRKLAGLTSDYTLFGMRHTRCIHLKLDGAKDSDIMNLMGHADFATTAKYLRDLGIATDEGRISKLSRKF
jgi:Phage integrase family